MTHVLRLAPLDLARRQRQARMRLIQRLIPASPICLSGGMPIVFTLIQLKQPRAMLGELARR